MYKVFEFTEQINEKGKLLPVEFSTLNLFEIKRLYNVYDNKMQRGGHAHIVEEEFFIMSKGSSLARLHDGNKWIEIKLEEGKNGLYVGKMVWHEFIFESSESVLTALSSTNYNPNREDYIEDFDTFLNS